MSPQISSSLLLATALLAANTAIASDEHYNRVSLRAETSAEVPHDLMHVTLYAEARNSDAAALAREISQTLNQAIEHAKSAPEVKVSSGNRHSNPVYDDKGKKIIAWQERAELRLESTEFAQLSSLTGTLLERMNMGSMRFSIAHATRQQQENQLLEQTIEAFNQRARQTTKALGGKEYKLVNLSLNSQGGYQPPMYARTMMAAPAPMADSAPQVEAGNTELRMSADGQIEILH